MFPFTSDRQNKLLKKKNSSENFFFNEVTEIQLRFFFGTTTNGALFQRIRPSIRPDHLIFCVTDPESIDY